MLRLFNACILSYEVGAYKPDQKIFEAALETAGSRPQECIFIDDIDHYTEAPETWASTPTHLQRPETGAVSEELKIIKNRFPHNIPVYGFFICAGTWFHSTVNKMY